MRYAGMLSVVFLAVLAAFALYTAPGGGYANAAENGSGTLVSEVEMYGVTGVESDGLGGYGGYGYQDTAGLTCGNYKPDSGARWYYFGFKRLDGYCGTNKFFANSYNEAWTCARSFCTTCSTVEDITDRLTEKEKTFSGSMDLKYCPSK